MPPIPLSVSPSGEGSRNRRMSTLETKWISPCPAIGSLHFQAACQWTIAFNSILTRRIRKSLHLFSSTASSSPLLSRRMREVCPIRNPPQLCMVKPKYPKTKTMKRRMTKMTMRRRVRESMRIREKGQTLSWRTLQVSKLLISFRRWISTNLRRSLSRRGAKQMM